MERTGLRDKRMSVDEVVAQLESGMTIGVGGWGSRRKPMALVRGILRSDLKDLTIVTYGGPEVGLLCQTGKVARVVYGFVSLDSIPLEPLFSAARQNGTVAVTEYDEGMLLTGLRAAAQSVPFLPTRAGLGSDVVVNNPELRTVISPYGGEELIAMPALRLDAALIHLNIADAYGNGRFTGVDPYFDDVYCMAADRAFVSVEKIVSPDELSKDAALPSFLVDRTMIDGVVEAPGGALFTSCDPDYARDEKLQAEYVRAAAAGGSEWDDFSRRFVEVSEDVFAVERAKLHEGEAS